MAGSTASLTSSAAIAQMLTPPSGVDSSYGMGWQVDEADPMVLRHTGVLSTFSAEQALLSESGDGVVALYYAYSAMAGYAGITDALIAAVRDEDIPASGMGARRIGYALAVLTLLTLALRIRALAGAGRWASRRRGTSAWRRLGALTWLVLLVVVLVSLPALVARVSDRVFGYTQLALAMPGALAFLVVAAASGLAVAVARTFALNATAGRGRPPAGGRE